ncbi:MAG: hypothetical protein JNL60_06205 [Bacteroidia bacterium]|nr:hypothetical protein [Bacteroidia bacterium]
MKNKISLILCFLVLSFVIVKAQPVFAHANQTIELTEPLVTSDWNAASIVIGGSPISVTHYSFDFSTSGSFTSNASGWCGIVDAGNTYGRPSKLIPNLEIGSLYYVRVCYESGGNWYASTITSTFATTFGSI